MTRSLQKEWRTVREERESTMQDAVTSGEKRNLFHENILFFNRNYDIPNRYNDEIKNKVRFHSKLQMSDRTLQQRWNQPQYESRKVRETHFRRCGRTNISYAMKKKTRTRSNDEKERGRERMLAVTSLKRDCRNKLTALFSLVNNRQTQISQNRNNRCTLRRWCIHIVPQRSGPQHHNTTTTL